MATLIASFRSPPRRLGERARALGGPAELVTYPGAGHVFDFAQTRTDARVASDRALSFMQNQLK